MNIFYRNRQLLLLAVTLLFVWGTSSFLSLPRVEDPELAQRYALITTQLPGASAKRIETLVTKEIEEELAEVEEIDSIESTSRQNFSSVVVGLEDRVTDVDSVWALVRDRLSALAAQLPADASAPDLEISQVKANAIIVALTWDLASPANYNVLHRLAEDVQDQIRSIPGTEQVKIYGAPAEEIAIEVQPDQLAALGLSVQSLAAQVENSDAKVGAGQLYGTDSQLSFEVAGELASLNQIRNIPISLGDQTHPRYLEEIAQVQKQVIQPATELAFIHGKPAVGIAALISSQQQIEPWTESVHQVLDNSRASLPEGLSLEVVFEQNRYVQSRLRHVMINLGLSACLVTAITLLLMGGRAAIAVGVSLVLSVLAIFSVMGIGKIPLHQISITGIIISLGLLIDNAIIIVDEIESHLPSSRSPYAAVTTAVKKMWVPLSASTLTTVLAFIPIATSTGATGEFTGTVGVIVIIALASSLSLSLTLVPAFCASLYKGVQKGHSTPPNGEYSQEQWWQSGFSYAPLNRAYRRSVNKSLASPLLSVCCALILPIGGFLTFPVLEQQFFPPSNRDQCYVEIELPAQTSILQTESVIRQSRELILQHPDVVDVQWFVGRSAPEFYYSVVTGRENAANFAQGIIQVNASTEMQSLIQDLQRSLDHNFPAAQTIVRQLEQGPPFAAPIEIRVYGPDLDQLRSLGESLRAELIHIPNITHTRSALSDTLPQLSLSVNEEKARLVGLDKTAIAQQLDAYLEGVVGGSLIEGTKEIPIRVRLPDEQRRQLADISSLYLLPATADRQPIPLSTIADIQLMPSVATIARRNGQRINTVQGFITAGILPSQVLSDFQAKLKAINFELPSGYRYDIGGEADEQNVAISNLISTLGILAILMASTLILTFRSFYLAAVIGLVAFLSVGLGLLSLWLFGYPFGFMSILGMIGLLGIVVNDSIVMLSAIHRDARIRQGDFSAISGIVAQSTRHIVTTTATTIIGFLPLMFDLSGFWPPLAITIIGGLAGSTIMALYFVPAIYVLIQQPPRQSLFARPTDAQSG